MSFSAVIIDEHGADHGPIDISSARNEAEARAMATQAGMKWLNESGAERAFVQISRDGYGFRVEVRA